MSAWRYNDRSLALAKESPGVVDELDVAPQRKTLHHAFAGRIQATAVFDRTEPKRIFQTGRGMRAGNTAVFRGCQSSGRTLSLDVIQSLLDRRIIACLWSYRNLGCNRVQIYIDGCS